MNSDLSFLWFKPTKAEAWNQMISPVIDKPYRGQLNFLPKDPKPYIQITQSPTSLLFNESDYEVYLVDCNNEEFDIFDHADIKQLTDPTGIKQIYIRLKYLPLDYGSNLVCIKINTTVDVGGGFGQPKTWYSNPFLLTGLFSSTTVRIDYLETRPFVALSDTPTVFNSVRLAMHRDNYVSGTDLTTYYAITKSQTVISRVDKKRYLRWAANKMDSWHWVRLEEALYNSRCYFDFIRNYPAEALEFEPRLGDSNMNEQFFLTDPNEKDVINIVSIIIDPEILYVPMLASTDVLASTDQLTSEIETPIT